MPESSSKINKADEFNGFEQGAVNMVTGFVLGTVYGGFRYYWALGPTRNVEVRPIIMTEIANTLGKYSLKCTIVAGIYSLGTGLVAGVRNKNDQWNHAAGGAALGAYTAFNGVGGPKVHVIVSKMLIYGALGVAVQFGVQSSTTSKSYKDKIAVYYGPYRPAAEKPSL